jgi:nucleotide-binding universal stress UspA family protein
VSDDPHIDSERKGLDAVMDTIVVGVDGSKHSLDALRWAVDEGRRRHLPVAAVFARAYPYAIPTVKNLSDPAIELGRAEEYLEALLRQELDDAAAGINVRAEEGTPSQVLMQAAQDAALLVVGSRGRGGFAGLLLGSVSLQCAQHAGCPVVVVRTGDNVLPFTTERRTPRIVVGCDGSEASRTALHWAVAEARSMRATIDAVHAWQPPYAAGYPLGTIPVRIDEFERMAHRLLDEAVAGATTPDVHIDPILVSGAAAVSLLDIAKGADLVVMGAHNGSYAGMLLGSVTQKVLHHATCPVVVIPRHR